MHETADAVFVDGFTPYI